MSVSNLLNDIEAAFNDVAQLEAAKDAAAAKFSAASKEWEDAKGKLADLQAELGKFFGTALKSDSRVRQG